MESIDMSCYYIIIICLIIITLNLHLVRKISIFSNMEVS